MKPRSTVRSLLLVGSTLLAISYSHAATLYWDGNDTNANANGGPGTWDNQTTSNWDTAAIAGSDSQWTNSNNDTAVFSNTAGTVSLGSNISVGGLTFSTTAYNIATGAGTDTLSFGATNNTILLNNNIATATITGTVGGAGNVILKRSNPFTAGALTFTGTSPGGWSGTTTVNAGMTLAIEGSTANRSLLDTSAINLNGGSITMGTGVISANSAVNFISDSAPVTVTGGGSFSWRPVNAGPTFSELIGAVRVNSGQMSFATGTVSSGSATLVIPSIARSADTSALVFSLGNNNPLVDGNFNKIQVSGSGTTSGWVSGATSNPIIGAWATTGTTGAVDYAVYSGNNVVSAATAASGETNWTDSAKAYTLTNAAKTATTLTATRNLNALKNSSAATAFVAADVNITDDTIALASHGLMNGDVVTFGGTPPAGLSVNTTYYVVGATAGTIQVSATSGGGAVNITAAAASNVTGGIKLSSGNNLGTSGILNASTAAFAIGSDTVGALTLPSATSGQLHVNAATAGILVNVPITNNGEGILTLVKNGAATVFLSGTNTYSGGTVINAGTLNVSSVNHLGGANSNLTFNGNGTLSSTAALNFGTGTLSVSRGATANLANGNSITFGITTGEGAINYGTGNNTSLALGNASAFTGDLRITVASSNGRTISFSSLGDAAGAGNLQFTGGTSDSGRMDTFLLTGGTSPLTFDYRQIEIQPRTSSNWEVKTPTLTNNNALAANRWVINTPLINNSGRNATLELGGSNSGDNRFAGAIGDSTVGTPPVGGFQGGNTGVLSLNKAGASQWILAGANTYTGATTVSAGTLAGIGTNAFGSTAGISIAGVGTLSLRGDSSTNFVKTSDSSPYTVSTSATGATITVDQATIVGTGAKTMTLGDLGTSSTAGTYQLNFTGANNTSLSAGTLSTPVSIVAAAHTITNNIADGGSLTLASVFNQATTVASPNLVFAGTGTTIITGAITQTLADMDLIKNGAGTLLLNGTNTYTGLTSVNAGTLGGTGTIAGDVTVAAPASLAPGASAGTLTIGGGLNISAPASDGSGKLKFELGANTAASDQLAVNGTLTIGGGVLGISDFVFSDLPGGPQNTTYTLITSGGINPGDTLNGSDLSGPIGVGGTGTLQLSGGNLELVVTGLSGDVTPPTLTSIVDDKGGSPITAGTLVTYTVSFSEDMNAASVTSGDFSNAGSSTITIGTITETSPGVFTVEVTPTNAGTLTLQIPVGATLTDASGNPLDNDPALVDDTTITITVSDPYAAWSGGAAFAADANNDGVDNGLAWLLGAANPGANANGLLPTVSQSGGNLILTFSTLNAANRGGAALELEHSSDLGISDPWASALVPETSGTVGGVNFVITADGNFNDVVATIPVSQAAAGKLFGRLNAESAP